MPERQTGHMRHALSLAARHLGQTWPNPAVGCVIVSKEQVVGAGWTARGGRPHAETQALAQAGAHAEGATAYVTLEPCAHTGRTPPCVQALIDAGIARVQVACRDPDPRVNGRGIAMLRQAGITVEEGLCRQEAESLNAGFFLRIQENRPFVGLKIATSADEKIAFPPSGEGGIRWITGEAARAYGHGLRARCDAVLTGIGTALTDDPLLTCRLPGLGHCSPVRVILDRQLRLPLGSTLAQTAKEAPLWVMTANKDLEKTQTLETIGARVLYCPGMEGEKADAVLPILHLLAGLGITRLLVEGGQAVTTAFISIAEEIYWFRAPFTIGEADSTALHGGKLRDMMANPRYIMQEKRPLGEDTLEIHALCSPALSPL